MAKFYIGSFGIELICKQAIAQYCQIRLNRESVETVCSVILEVLEELKYLPE